MQDAIQKSLLWIASQQDAMLEQVIRWSEINSGSTNLAGLARMADEIESAFADLGAGMERLSLTPMHNVNAKGELIEQTLGKALRFRKHADAPLQILLTGHMDTVFPADSPFQTHQRIDLNTINAPGAVDMKGGIIVMLHALLALESSPWAGQVGWEVLINPDEEIGSIGSSPLLVEAAKRNHLGLTYEPGLPDGTLAGARKGSGNFVAVMRGRSAHAGRNPQDGRNAIVALAEFILALQPLAHDGITVNAGKLEGGGPVNVVPDLAICRFNVRVSTHEEQKQVEAALQQLTTAFSVREGYSLELHGGFTRPPKILSQANMELFELVKECGVMLGLNLQEKPTGGCCDGNNLAAHGLPNVDTLGVRGSNIHSHEEAMVIDSLTERAQLSALLLLRLASGEIKFHT